MSEDKSFLSWHGAITGPYDIGEIRTMLRLGKVNSLYKINVNGQWILLRDHLAELDRMARIQVPKVVQEDHEAVPPGVSPQQPIQTDSIHQPGDEWPSAQDESPAKGIAIASFVLSLFFFVPFLNGVTALLSLIFGHLALAQMSGQQKSKSKDFASTGLWMTYVYMGFLLLSTAWYAFAEEPDLNKNYLGLHACMLVIAITSLIGAGVLMLVIKMISNRLLSLLVSLIACTLPTAFNVFGILVIARLLATTHATNARSIVCFGMFQVLVFVVQMFFWADFIKLPDGMKLGVKRAAVASLSYCILFVFLAYLYGLVLSAAGFKNADQVLFGQRDIHVAKATSDKQNTTAKSSTQPPLPDTQPQKSRSAQTNSPVATGNKQKTTTKQLAHKLSDADIYAKVSPCCVRITTGKSLGSGFFFKKGGYILTNHHVVEEPEPITVKLDDGRSYNADLVAKAPGELDLAIIRIPLDKHDIVLFRDEEQVRIGEPVVLVGYPYKDLPTATMNSGRISNTNRTFMNNPVYQLDVSANHGNSGSPVVDESAHLVGILTYGLGDQNIDRFNFAIQIGAIREFVDKHVTR